MGNRIKACGYLKSSEDDISLPVQRNRLLALAEREGYEIIQWYVDEGNNANTKRPDWRKLLSEYAPIQAEWERLKKERKGELNWYTLFGGPNDLRSLSKQIGKGSFYEILYRRWSDFAHAGGAFSTINKGNGVGISVKPIRCPEGIEQACNFAYQISVETVFTVIKAVASDEWPTFQQRIVKELRQRGVEVATKKIIKINWVDRPEAHK